MRFWRDFVEERAGQHIESLADFVLDQREFAGRCRSILADLGFAADLDDQPGIQRQRPGRWSPWRTLPIRRRSSRRRTWHSTKTRMGDEDGEGEATMVEMDADMDLSELGADGEPEDAPNFSPDELGRIRVNHDYAAYTDEFDEVVKAAGSLRTGGTPPPAANAGPAASVAAARHLETRQSPAAAPARQAEPDLGVRSRRGHSRHLAPGAGGHRTR